jgi:hypothetical protein
MGYVHDTDDPRFCGLELETRGESFKIYGHGFFVYPDVGSGPCVEFGYDHVKGLHVKGLHAILDVVDSRIDSPRAEHERLCNALHLPAESTTETMVGSIAVLRREIADAERDVATLRGILSAVPAPEDQ